MKILALTRYGSLGSSSRVRFYQYIPGLSARGLEISIVPLLGDDYVRNLYAGKRQSIPLVIKAYANRVSHLLKGRRVDLLWIEKELFPWLPAVVDGLFLHRDIPYVVDYDDAVFHRYDMHANPLIRAFLGRKIDAVMRRAAAVVAGNDYLAERARRAGAGKIEFLPSVVDLERYAVKEKAGGIIRIGWIGSPVTAPYLGLIREALEEVIQQSGARLVLVGAGDHDPLPGLPKDLLPWSEESETAQLQSFDVGIMPLPDGPFEQGKCGYKLIQYMACGLPVVASPVGMNQRIVEGGRMGFLASNRAEWVQTLTELVSDAEMRRSFGQAGRRKVEQAYCLAVTAPRLLGILMQAAVRP